MGRAFIQLCIAELRSHCTVVLILLDLLYGSLELGLAVDKVMDAARWATVQFRRYIFVKRRASHVGRAGQGVVQAVSIED